MRAAAVRHFVVSLRPGERHRRFGVVRHQVALRLRFGRRLAAQFHPREHRGHPFLQLVQHGVEESESLALVFVQRVALAIGAQPDALAQMVERQQVLVLEQDRNFPESLGGGRRELEGGAQDFLAARELMLGGGCCCGWASRARTLRLYSCWYQSWKASC